jgi:hypothetical protein
VFPGNARGPVRVETTDEAGFDNPLDEKEVPLSVSMTPPQLQALTSAALVRAAELGRRLDDMQDALSETRHPEVPQSDPRWDDNARWVLTPPELDDDVDLYARDWPGGDS